MAPRLLLSVLLTLGPPLQAAEFEVVDMLTVNGVSTLKSSLDVQSDASFGSTAQSTFTAAGVLELASPLGSLYGGTGANLSAGALGGMPYFSAVGVMGPVPAGVSGQVLRSNGAAAPSWLNQSSLIVLRATNLAGGALGSIPYQSAANSTAMLSAGTAGQVLQTNGAAIPSWITATDANTASAIVKRDAAGAFSAGAITANGTLTVLGSTFLSATGPGGTTAVELGQTATGDRISHIDMVGDATYTDYGTRWLREGGATGRSQLLHRGTGPLEVAAVDAGSVTLRTQGNDRLTVAPAGNVGIGTSNPVRKLHVSGGDINLDAGTALRIGDEVALSRTAGGEVQLVGTLVSDYPIFRAGGSERMRITTTGDVGVGTSTPNAKLHVYDGSLRFNSGWGLQWGGVTTTLVGVSGLAGYQAFTTASAERMRIDASGFVGIGTTAPALPLEVGIQSGATTARFGSVNGINLVSNSPMVGFNAFWGPSGPTRQSAGTAGFLTFDQDISGGFSLNTTTSDGAGTVFSPSSRMVITNLGNVGIGTTNPLYALDANGEVAARGSNAFRLRNASYSTILRNDGTDTYALLTALSDPDGSWNTLRPFRINNPTGDVYLGNSAVTVKHGGNIGLGSTSPATKLDIVGDLSMSGGGGEIRFRNAAGTIEQFVWHSGTSIGIGPGSSTNSVFVTNTGRVGIGTNAPTAKLEVTGTGSTNGFQLGADQTTPVTFYYMAGPPQRLEISPTTTQIHYGTAEYLVDGGANQTHFFGDVRVGTSGTNGCVQRFDGTAIVGTCSSDRRYKRNVQPVTGALQKLSLLRPVTYQWEKDKFPDKKFGTATSWGLIAQDVEGVMPELVQPELDEDLKDTGFKSVSYGIELQMLMIQAIKELKAENEALKARIAAIEGQGR